MSLRDQWFGSVKAEMKGEKIHRLLGTNFSLALVFVFCMILFLWVLERSPLSLLPSEDQFVISSSGMSFSSHSFDYIL